MSVAHFPDLLFSATNRPTFDVYAARARHSIQRYHGTTTNQLILEGLKKEREGKQEDPSTPVKRPTSDNPVCIIGAGAAGLYTAMIFDSLDIPYVILEESARVGGRLFTYKGFKDAEPYDYFEVGAMRFANNPFMKRTFDLMKKLNVKLIDYILDSPTTKNFYPYSAEGYVPQSYYDQGYEAIMDNVLNPFRELFARNPIDEAIAQLMEFDMYTVRSWMTITVPFGGSNITHRDVDSVGAHIAALRETYPSSVVNWCETLYTSTGSFDRALAETILDSVAFDWPSSENGSKPVKWSCVDGGSQELAEAMHKTLKRSVEFKKKVTAIAESESGMTVTYEEDGKQSLGDYFSVVSTMPLPRLRFVNLTESHLTYSQWSAIRELQYGPDVKVGIRFKEPWWDHLPDGRSIIGGETYTDLPIRTVVYPSYPAGMNKSRVLIASYCWTQDAERLGALVNWDGTAKPELINEVMNNLATVHGIDVDNLWGLYEPDDYFAWDWLHDPITMGGIAQFGPQQFSDQIYPSLTMPLANNKMFIAGEATSSAHGWVAGALDSAWRSVHQFLDANKYSSETKAKFFDLWGQSEYWDDELIENHTYLGEFFSRLRSGSLRDGTGKPMHSTEDVLKEWAVKNSA